MTKKPSAPHAVRAAHDAVAEQGLVAVGLDVDVDLERAGEETGNEKQGHRGRADGIQGTSAKNSEVPKTVTKPVVRAPSRSMNRAEKVRPKSRCDMTEEKAEFALGQPEGALKIGQPRHEGPERKGHGKLDEEDTLVRLHVGRSAPIVSGLKPSYPSVIRVPADGDWRIGT